MMKYLSEAYGDRATNGDKSLLDMLRDEAGRLELLMVNLLIIDSCSILERETGEKEELT
jgi:hypothetical protein